MLEKVKDTVERLRVQMDRGQVQDQSHWESSLSFGSVRVQLMTDKQHGAKVGHTGGRAQTGKAILGRRYPPAQAPK